MEREIRRQDPDKESTAWKKGEEGDREEEGDNNEFQPAGEVTCRLYTTTSDRTTIVNSKRSWFLSRRETPFPTATFSLCKGSQFG